jgi:hypothetical protein
MALPALMSFPHTALDVVEIVKFAKKHRMQVSIKNSGHSYSGQSSRKDSIQLNMRRYPILSKAGVYECESVEPASLAAAPCTLAMARGKGAVARVGGGEGNDDVLRNLGSWNFQLPRNQTYQAMAGAEGMIGAGGGWFQGGGLGTGQCRMWGVGSDQVVLIEMVLPDGTHVKFGPTEWEAQEGLMYPQTTKVEGLCNKNVQHRESQWQWGACDDHSINFEDLWFAVRGGGGGTWGVILAVWYQLHSLTERSFYVKTDFAAVSALQETVPNQTWEDVKSSVKNMWTDFLIEFLWKPSALGVPEEVSGSCGYTGVATSDMSPWDIFGPWPLTPAFPDNFLLTCLDNSAHKVLIEAWKKYVPTSKYKPSGNLTERIQSLLTSCMTGSFNGQNFLGLPVGGKFCFNEVPKPAPVCASLPKADQDETMLQEWEVAYMRSPLGQLLDINGGATSWPYAWAALLPVSMITEHDRDWVIQTLHAFESHHVMGGKLRVAGDGMTVQPKGYREAGLSVILTPGKLGVENNGTAYLAKIAEISDLILQYLGVSDNESADGFPGFTEINHQPGRFAGPLKSDWRTPCPFDFTAEQRRTQCMSVQETIWGTSNLKRLEGIKEKLDPENLFTVHFGVGNKDVIGVVESEGDLAGYPLGSS